MKTALKILAVLLGVVLVAFIGLIITILVRWDRTFEVEAPDIEASSDADVIARGEYLFNSASACILCHHEDGSHGDVVDGALPPPSGGRVLPIGPPGELHVPNLTPHSTGIGDLSDGQLARALRYGVRHDDRAMWPIMEYQTMADADVRALISYLRSLEPVENEVPEHDYSMLGKGLLAFVIEPVGPHTDIPTRPESGLSVENGEYLAKHVSMCFTCHTDHTIGATDYGTPFAGGFRSPLENGDTERVIVTPNLTPDPETGVIYGWTEDEFVARFRDAEPSIPNSIMPWVAYARMTDDDLRSIFRYLNSLEPVEADFEAGLQDVE